MARLDIERQKEIEPERFEYAKQKLSELGLEITYNDGNRLEFMFKGHKIQLYPYSGWHTGKSIRAGRGIKNLLNQLKRSDVEK